MLTEVKRIMVLDYARFVEISTLIVSGVMKL